MRLMHDSIVLTSLPRHTMSMGSCVEEYAHHHGGRLLNLAEHVTTPDDAPNCFIDTDGLGSSGHNHHNHDTSSQCSDCYESLKDPSLTTGSDAASSNSSTNSTVPAIKLRTAVDHDSDLGNIMETPYYPNASDVSLMSADSLLGLANGDLSSGSSSGLGSSCANGSMAALFAAGYSGPSGDFIHHHHHPLTPHHGFYTMTVPTLSGVTTSVASAVPGSMYHPTSNGHCSMEFTVPNGHFAPGAPHHGFYGMPPIYNHGAGVGITPMSSAGCAAANGNPPAGGTAGQQNGAATSSNGGTHQNHHAHSSRYSPSPAHSRGSSPINFSASGQSQPLPTVGQHAVYVHVNPGETLSVRVGNEIQHIPGPATVRMVSQNPGLPAPLPLHVPPGHIVQQIVDENGVLRHLILSPQHPPPPGYVQQYPSVSLTANGPIGHSVSFIPSVPPSTSNGGFGGFSPSPPAASMVHHMTGTPPPMQYHPHICEEPSYYPDARVENARKRLKAKLVNRKAAAGRRDSVDGSKARGDSVPDNTLDESGSANEDEETTKLMELLSKIQPPQICCVDSREATLQWQAVDCTEASSGPFPEIEASDFTYQVLLAERTQDSKYQLAYVGPHTDKRLCNLKPATEYFVKLCALLNELDLEGRPTAPVGFCTKPCAPDKPLAPRLEKRAKTSITLRWNPPTSNGAAVQMYHLECDQGRGDNSFAEVYCGPLKKHVVSRLDPATTYRFRLAAVNEHGRSEWSDILLVHTSGQAPPMPDPPQLLEAYSDRLHLIWHRRPEDEAFILQMEDPASGLFIPVHHGAEVSFMVSALERSTAYKFRLIATNEGGQSKESPVIILTTLPDRPQPPCKPYTKGRIHASSVKVGWDAPKDSGGSEVHGYQLEMDAGQGWAVLYAGSERECHATGLEPGRTFHFRVLCVSAGGQSGYSESLAVTTSCVVPGTCRPPVQHAKPRPNALHIRWGPPDSDGGAEITDYEVQMASPDGSTRVVLHGLKTECAVANLLPGRTYTFRVRAHNRSGPGNWSEPFACTTGAGPPDAPTELACTARSHGIVHVQWTEPCANGAPVTEYRLQQAARRVLSLEVPEVVDADGVIAGTTTGCTVEPEPSSVTSSHSSASSNQSTPSHQLYELDYAEFTTVYTGSQTNYEVRGLKPAADYAFRVQAVNSAGTSKLSKVCTCQTPAAPPATVPNVQTETVSLSEISLMWDQPEDNGSVILGYNVDVSPVPDSVSLPIQISAHCTHFTVEDLLPETVYKFRVQAVNEMGVGLYSAPVKGQTYSRPPMPPTLECVAAGHNTLKLKWTDAQSSQEQYLYSLEMENKSGSFSPLFEGPSRLHRVLRLSECTAYKFRIRATSQTGGQGPWSGLYTFMTTRAPPPAPKSAPRVVETSESSWQVEWPATKVSYCAGERVQYQLQLHSAKSSSAPEEYKTVYQGPSTSYSLNHLPAGLTCRVRVCLVRVCEDEELAGPCGPSSAFSTTAIVTQKSTEAVSDGLAETTTAEPSKKEWTDQQIALIFVAVFCVAAVLLALVMQWFFSER